MKGLSEADFGPDPVAEFGKWMAEAQAKSGQRNPNAMTLCTVGPDGWPQGRVLLLKEWGPQGFVFYTNLGSEKGLALAASPRAELVLHWDALGRQVRVRGQVEELGRADAAAYFVTRPRESQLGAWASAQTQPVASRAAMDQAYAQAEARFAGADVPLPPSWGGYRLRPERIELWQEAAFRFHDRFRYTLHAGQWSLSRLNP